MRKSQIYSQAFIYILTVIVISFILVFGYNAVVNFKKRADQVSCLKFKNDLINAVDSITGDYGSVKRKDIKLCSDYMQVCFVETFQAIDKNNLPIDIDPIIKNNILSDTGRNAFLVEKIAKESFYVGNISVDGNLLCINSTRNEISLRLEGKGNYVLLSKWV